METARRRFLPRALLVAAMAALLLLMAAAPQPSRWSFVLVGAGCLAAIADGYAGIFFMLRSPRRERRPGLQLQVCALWLVNTLAYLVLLNTAAELAVPGSFQLQGGQASLLDVAYLTILTFASSGYGDVLPANPLGKLLSMLTSFSGLLYATMLFTAIWQHYAPDRHE